MGCLHVYHVNPFDRCTCIDQSPPAGFQFSILRKPNQLTLRVSRCLTWLAMALALISCTALASWRWGWWLFPKWWFQKILDNFHPDPWGNDRIWQAYSFWWVVTTNWCQFYLLLFEMSNSTTTWIKGWWIGNMGSPPNPGMNKVYGRGLLVYTCIHIFYTYIYTSYFLYSLSLSSSNTTNKNDNSHLLFSPPCYICFLFV